MYTICIFVYVTVHMNDIIFPNHVLLFLMIYTPKNNTPSFRTSPAGSMFRASQPHSCNHLEWSQHSHPKGGGRGGNKQTTFQGSNQQKIWQFTHCCGSWFVKQTINKGPCASTAGTYSWGDRGDPWISKASTVRILSHVQAVKNWWIEWLVVVPLFRPNIQ